FLAERGERGASLRLRLDGDDEQHMVLIDREHAERGGDEQKERRRDHPFRTPDIVKKAAEQAAEGAGDDEDDSEDAELLRAPAERGCGVDAAEGEYRAKPVGIEHARQKKERDLAVVPDQVLERAHELAEGCRHRAFLVWPAWPVWREQKQRQ